jgi:DNA anti-recombination protein RmuC
MAETRVERMEQQFSSLQKTLENFMKASSEQTKKLAASIEDLQSKDSGEDSTGLETVPKEPTGTGIPISRNWLKWIFLSTRGWTIP